MQTNHRRSLSVLPAAAALALCCAVGSAEATVVTSSTDCADTPRSITVSTADAASCVATGRGMTGGSTDAFRRGQAEWEALEIGSPAQRLASNWLGGALGGAQGNFIIDRAAWAAYDHLALGFQTGGSRSDPDWVVFQLADGTLDGLWAISAQNVSHVVLYGIRASEPTLLAVPEPGSLALAGLAGAGLLATRRRKPASTRV